MIGKNLKMLSDCSRRVISNYYLVKFKFIEVLKNDFLGLIFAGRYAQDLLSLHTTDLTTNWGSSREHQLLSKCSILYE